MKRLIAGISALALMAGMMTACSKSVPENTVHSIDDLAGKTIGVQMGTTGMKNANDIEGASVDKYNKAADAVQALAQGKVDAVLIDNEPAKYFVQKNTDLEILPDPFVVEEYAIAVKKGNDELTQQINTAIQQIKDEGILAEIEANWIGEEYGEHPYTSPDGVTYDGELVMATNAEFPPYEFKEDGEIVGFDVDMMRAVCDKLGKKLVIEDMVFDSIVAAVETGKADVGTAGMTVTEERLEKVDFSDTYTTSRQVIIVRKNKQPE